MGNNKITGTADAKLADYGRMGAAQHPYDLALGAAIRSKAADAHQHAISMHRAAGGVF